MRQFLQHINWKIFFTIAFTLGVLNAALVLLIPNALLESHRVLDQEQAKNQLKLTLRHTQYPLNHLIKLGRRIAVDPTIYRRLQGSSTVPLQRLWTQVSADADSLIIVGPTGEHLYSFPEQLHADHPIEAFHQRLQQQTQKLVPLPSKGVYATEHGPLLASITPIIPPNTDAPVGYVAISHYLSRDEQQDILPVAKDRLSFHPLRDSDVSEVFSGVAASMHQGIPLALHAVSQEEMRGYALINDPFGQPTTVLTLSMGRDFLKQGRQTVDSLLMLIHLASVAIGLVLYLVKKHLAEERRKVLRQKQHYSTLVDHLDLGVALLDDTGRVQLSNPPAERFLNFLSDHPRYQHWFESPPAKESPLAQALESGVSQTRELNEVEDGQNLWSLQMQAIPVHSTASTTAGCIYTLEDTLAQKQVERQIQQLVFQDNLTDLPNRTQFTTQLQLALAAARQHQGLVAMIHLDIDRFKNINDTLGYAEGDRVLQMLSSRLKAEENEGAILARLGTDEFAYMTSVRSADDALHLAEQLLTAIAVPLKLEERELFITASAGLAIAPEDGEEAGDLISHAGMALAAAKQEGGNCCHFYSQSMQASVQERHTLEGGLRKALANDELYLVYQPQIDSRTGRLIGVEALARWRHPTLGMISPGRFIPIAEDTDLIRPIGEWTLETACRQSKLWQDAGHPQIRMAVNLSGYQLQNEEVIGLVERILKQTGLEPQYLELEMTETALIQNAEATRKILAELKSRGLQIAMDDFGTGYSSLSYLSNFSIDRVKIDQSFVRGIGIDSGQSTLVVTIIAMARALGLEVIAEGVETRQQLDFLMSHQCDEMQGYYFAKPMTVEQLDRLFKDGYSREGVCLFSADSLIL